MCLVGGPFGDVEVVRPKIYRCSACGKKFKAVGEDPACPSCQSNDLEELPDDYSRSAQSQSFQVL